MEEVSEKVSNREHTEESSDTSTPTVTVKEGFAEGKEVWVTEEDEETGSLNPEEKEKPEEKEESKEGEKEESSSKETKEEKEESEEEEEGNSEIKKLFSEIEKLKEDKRNLNIALHQLRQERKEQKSSETDLTDEQIEELLLEHGDDPKVLRNIFQYLAEKTSAKQNEVLEASRIKKETDSYVLQRWPDMADEKSDLAVRATETKKLLGIENHPMADYLSIGALIAEELPNLQAMAYEQGKKDALKEKAEKKRKVQLKERTLSSGGHSAGEAASLPEDFRATVKQLELTPAQQKIYARLVGGTD